MLQRIVKWLKFQLRMFETVPAEYCERARLVRCAERRKERMYRTYFIGY